MNTNHKRRITILDGGMGTMIQAAGIPVGERPEIFGLEHPEIIEGIHRKYIEAGSDIIYANTFGANSHKLAGTGHTAEELIRANVATAKKAAAAAGRPVHVALDVSPIGELLEPLGTLRFDEAYDLFKEMLIAGEDAGADLVIFETFSDLYEVKAGVLAAKENTSLPVWVTMSFEESGRTFLGTTVAAMALTLEGLGVDAIGINCSLGPKEILPLIEEMTEWTDLPIIVKPNAGLPDPRTGEYAMDAEEFGKEMAGYLPLGVSAMGGCCGTTPDFIKVVADMAAEAADSDAFTEKRPAKRRGVCSSSYVAELDGGIRVIGERINPTGKKRFQQALREHDLTYIMERAIEQQEAGAEILDINVGLPGIDEAAMMTEVVKAVQSVVNIPLQIDSPKPEVIEAGLRAVNGRAIVNSVNGEKERQAEILPIVKKYGAAVVGLTMDKGGLPETAEERFEIAGQIVSAAEAHGIPREDVLIDCLTLTISAQQDQAMETLKAVRRVHDELGLHCLLGVSNISFGLPARSHITENFLIQAMNCGLDLPIINPNQKNMMDAVWSFRALSGEDSGCEKYIERFAAEDAAEKANKKAAKNASPAPEKKADNVEAREGASGAPEGGPSEPVDMLRAAIFKGLAKEAENITKELMETMDGMDVINSVMIPALDVVGDRFEKGEIFLPQLINSANAACAGLDYIKLQFAKTGAGITRGKILVATVEGDIHDIGKNIVKVVLENYGYQVLDLGKDVPVEKVVEAAQRENIELVGLSALMTTTVESMKRTVAALRASGHKCMIMVGGAVLTPEYAKEIGADYYAKDAKASADIAKEVLG